MLDPAGPSYPLLGATVEKYRRRAKQGLAKLSREDRIAYGDAVHAAILALQRRELLRVLPPANRCNCASRTWYTTGDEIHEAIKRQQLNALLACPAKERNARTPQEWQKLYERAMQNKDRKRAA
jgi:hypothetical protein